MEKEEKLAILKTFMASNELQTHDLPEYQSLQARESALKDALQKLYFYCLDECNCEETDLYDMLFTYLTENTLREMDIEPPKRFKIVEVQFNVTVAVPEEYDDHDCIEEALSVDFDGISFETSVIENNLSETQVKGCCYDNKLGDI